MKFMVTTTEVVLVEADNADDAIQIANDGGGSLTSKQTDAVELIVARHRAFR